MVTAEMKNLLLLGDEKFSITVNDSSHENAQVLDGKASQSSSIWHTFCSAVREGEGVLLICCCANLIRTITWLSDSITLHKSLSQEQSMLLLFDGNMG